MEKPSFKSSPWIRGAPHRVFSRDIRRTRSRISLDTGGRPGFPRRDFHVQKSLNPLRCQPMTVSGLTITRAWRQPGHRQDRMTQKTLSAFRSNGRGLFRFRTATCCRRARISVWSAARSAKISMILCMPERVSGGDAEFQGLIDGINGTDNPNSIAGRRIPGRTRQFATGLSPLRVVDRREPKRDVQRDSKVDRACRDGHGMKIRWDGGTAPRRRCCTIGPLNHSREGRAR